MVEENKTKELITLESRQVGFVVYGLGGGVNRCVHRGQPLKDFLDLLWLKMGVTKERINLIWKKLDEVSPGTPENSSLIDEVLVTASWAYAVAVEITPFSKDCRHGPTDPLDFFYIKRLEEIFTKCFMIAHLYGDTYQSAVGLQGLITDFELNGGIDQKTGEKGPGLYTSLLTYHKAYFTDERRRPVTYQKFGELMSTIACRIKNLHPKAVDAFKREIRNMINDSPGGFGTKEIQSPAKTKLIELLENLIVALEADNIQDLDKLKFQAMAA